MSFTPVQTPGKSYRGVNLWFINDLLDDRELIRQLNNLDRAGCGAVIARTFDGLRTDYLSETFHERMRTIVDHADKLGMKVYLQAGYMPGGIPKLKPEHRSSVLVALDASRKIEPGDQVIMRDESFTYVTRFKNHYIDLLQYDAISSYLQQAYEEAWSKFKDDFGKAISSVWVDEPSFFPDQPPWTEQLPIRFEEKWGYSLLDHIPDLFRRSERSYKVRYHYRRIVLSMLIEAYFVQVSKWCDDRGVQFSGHLMGEDRLDSQIGHTLAAMPMYGYMHLPGIDHLTGNLRWSALDRSTAIGIPFLMTPKQCSSIANQRGQKTVLAEMYGVSSEGLTFQDQKRIAEFMAILGINHRCLHGSFYSMRGRRKRIYVPHLSEQQPWWDDYPYVADYFARLSYALQQGTYAADVLIVHPIESAYGLYEPLDFKKQNTADVYALNAHLVELSGNLLAAQIGFDYGDEHVMEQQASVNSDGSLQIGHMSYKIIILPMLLTIRESTLRLLEQFVERGGVLFATSSFPALVDCEPSAALGRLKDFTRITDHSLESLKASLAEPLAGREVKVHAAHNLESVWVHERSLEVGRLVYVLNTNEQNKIDVVLSSGRYDSVECYQLETGHRVKIENEQEERGTVQVSFSLEPWESKIVLLQAGTGDAESASPVAGPGGRAALNTIDVFLQEMTMERSDPNAITLDMCRYRKGSEPYSDMVPVVAVQQILTEENYEGPVTLCFEFKVEERPERIAVVIEDPDEFHIAVNDIAVKYDNLPYYVDPAFLPIDITSVVAIGTNKIELSRHFQPLKKLAFFHADRFQNLPGVELESVYLIGDFAVYGEVSGKAARDRCIRLAPGFELGAESMFTRESWPLSGYPFYSGSMVYRKRMMLAIPAANERIELDLSGMESCFAEVRINGRTVSKLAWKPFKADITNWILDGENEFEIIVTNTLRNLLGPHHHPKGEIDYSYGEGSYNGSYAPETGHSYPRWYANRTEDTFAWTDDYFFIAYGLKGMKVIRYALS